MHLQYTKDNPSVDLLAGCSPMSVGTAAQNANLTEIIDAVRLLTCGETSVVELRAVDVSTPSYRRVHTVSGYFDDYDKLATQAEAVAPYATAVYVTLNAINPALLARAANRVRVMDAGDSSTADADVRRRLWLPIDADPIRPAGISSSDQEHARALSHAAGIRDFLQSEGFPDPVEGDSGNGRHLLYRIDLPNDQASTDLLGAFLRALAFKTDDDRTALDQKVFNAGRIWKLYGTSARKGDSIPDRPHRQARLLSIPGQLAVVSRDLITKIALGDPTRHTAKGPTISPNGVPFDLAMWVEKHSLDVLSPSAWQGGERYIFRVCPWNPDHRNRSAYLLRLPSGAIAAGCHHNGCAGKGWHELRDTVEPGWQIKKGGSQRSTPGPVPPPYLAGSRAGKDDAVIPAGPVLTSLSTLVLRSVECLWKDRVPFGKVTLVTGDPGLGKSLLTLDMAAGLTVGRIWPDGADAPRPANVLFISAEDDPADTVLPRFLAAGGDPTRATMLTAVNEREFDDQGVPHDHLRALSLETHILDLEDAINKLGARLVVIDPITAYLGKADSHTDAEIRGVLMPLAAVAERTGAAIVAVMHLNKRPGGPAVYRPGGSIAFIAAARAAHVVTADPDDPTRRLFLPLKQNLFAPADGLAYRVEAATVKDDTGVLIPTARIVWEDGTVITTAAQALAAAEQSQEETSALSDAKEFLRDLLARGPIAAKDGERAYREAGIKESTLRRAREALGIKPYREQRGEDFGKDGRWFWSLPKQESGQPKMLTNALVVQDAHVEKPEHLSNLWTSKVESSAANGHVVDPNGIGLNGATLHLNHSGRFDDRGDLASIASIPLGAVATDTPRVGEPLAIGDLVWVVTAAGDRLSAKPTLIVALETSRFGVIWARTDDGRSNPLDNLCLAEEGTPTPGRPTEVPTQTDVPDPPENMPLDSLSPPSDGQGVPTHVREDGEG